MIQTSRTFSAMATALVAVAVSMSTPASAHLVAPSHATSILRGRVAQTGFGPQTGVGSKAALGVTAYGKSPRADIAGFRTASFGMSSEAVIAAVTADLAPAPDAFRWTDNALQRTRILQVSVDALPPAPGRAVINYIFGASSQRLIQVNVVWTPEAQGAGAQLAEAAQSYVQALSDLTWRAMQAGGGAEANGAVNLFTGLDLHGRRADVLITPLKAAPTDPALSATAADNGAASMTLSFSVNPAKPDIFTLKPGSF